ncbi:MAG: RNA-binding cell elongation regulator Jag/EloR [Veillonella sp.]|nr:RNA-binding cell elongation regulator Jag/EloR [Veillonella sp.]
MEFIDVSAKTIEDAIAKGVAQLAAEGQELVETKVLEQPSNGFLGIGRKPAVVRLFFTSVAKTATQEEVAHVEEQSVAVASKPVEKPSKKELSKEDQQEIAEKGKQFLDDMFTQMGLTVVIEKMMTKDKITFQVHGEDLGILIGKHGQTLDAIQYLTNLVAHKDVSGHCHIVVDVENYRSRREETLVNLAKRLASKVKRNRQKVSLEPMNAFERKIIHTALQGDKNVVTNSEGDEPFRHVVITYKK